MIVLSAIDDALPILCQTASPLNKMIASQVQSYTSDGFFSLDLHSQKLQMTAQVFLLAGRCLQYVYCLRNGVPVDESYASIDGDMEKIVEGLIRNEKTYSWMFCDSITVVLW